MLTEELESENIKLKTEVTKLKNENSALRKQLIEINKCCENVIRLINIY